MPDPIVWEGKLLLNIHWYIRGIIAPNQLSGVWTKTKTSHLFSEHGSATTKINIKYWLKLAEEEEVGLKYKIL